MPKKPKKAKYIKNITKRITEPSLRKIKNKIVTTTNIISSEANKINPSKSNISSKLRGLRLKLKYKQPRNSKNKRAVRQLLTIVNIYAPHSGLVKNDATELDKLYSDLNGIIDNFLNVSTSILMLAGDFNAIVGKQGENDSCLG